jgi:Icc protein
MRIIQLSDLHIDVLNQHPNGVDVRSNFLKVLDLIREYQGDFLVVSGDLSYKSADKEVYRWIRDQLKSLDLPVYVIPGNHDDPVLISEVFHPDKATSSSGKLYYFSKKMEELFFFLDTGDAYMGPQQFKWLEDLNRKYDPERLFLFMHHPPLHAGVPHMDGKHAFREIEYFDKMTRTFEKEVHVFAGHYHFQKSIQRNNLSLYICPSTFFQMKGENSEFEHDHNIPGFQIIDIDPEQVAVHVHYAF